MTDYTPTPNIGPGNLPVLPPITVETNSAAVTAYGLNPADVAKLVITPKGIEVTYFVTDEHGNRRLTSEWSTPGHPDGFEKTTAWYPLRYPRQEEDA